MLGKRLIMFFLLGGLCLTALGCESAKAKVKKADAWMQDNMW